MITKKILLLLAVVAVMSAPLCASAVDTDNLGRPIDTGEISTGFMVGVSDGETSLAYERNMLDATLFFSAAGANDGDGSNETTLLGAWLGWFITDSMTTGPAFEKKLGKDVIDLSWMNRAYIFPRPLTKLKPYLFFDPFTMSVATSPEGKESMSGTSSFVFDPKLCIGVQMPQDGYSLDFDVGYSYLFSKIDGETVADPGQLGVAGRVNIWLGR